jgi:hypothetical protein
VEQTQCWRWGSSTASSRVPTRGPSSGKEEHVNERATKWTRHLPHVCEHKCLATTKRVRGSGEGVEDLISDSGNDHDNDEASLS